MEDDDEIEMNDLLGHTKDNMISSTEEGTQRKKKNVHQCKPEKRLFARSRLDRCHLLVILVSLFGIIFFAIGIYFYLKRMDTTFEPQKKESKFDRYKDLQIEESSHPANCKSPTMAESNAAGHDCVNDPCFQLMNDSKKNCDWVAKHPNRHCGKQYTTNSLVRDHCPESCDECKATEESSNTESQESRTDNLILDYQMTIVDGVDDKDVYCEDLSQYEEWHNTEITKSDGVMFKVVKQIDHDEASFT